MSSAGTPAAGTPAGTGTEGTPAPAAPANWFDAGTPELKGYITNRGWHTLKPEEAALQAAKAHHEAEKLIGAPPDQMIRIPKDATDKEGWGKVWTRLGKPESKDKYDFGTVKFADQSVLSDDLVSTLCDAADELNLSTDGASRLASRVVKMIEASETADQAEYEAKLGEERAALAKNWGSNAVANKIVAENAALKLGVTQAELSALEKTVGYSRVMEMFRNIGSKIGEDKFVNGGQPGSVMTVDQARATLASRNADQEWMRKFEAGDTATVQEWHNLTKLIAGVS